MIVDGVRVQRHLVDGERVPFGAAGLTHGPHRQTETLPFVNRRARASCDGQLMSIAQNPDLFALVGNKFGGNGTTNFALPDLRGNADGHARTEQPGGNPRNIRLSFTGVLLGASSSEGGWI